MLISFLKMMKKILPQLFLTIFSLFLNVTNSAWAVTLEVVTTDFPPYQFQEGAELKGLATETVKEALSLSPHQGQISVYPWARAYQFAQGKKATLIFSIARTAEREKLFKWIGTVAPFQVYMWRLKKRQDIKATNLEEAKHFMVGGVFNDIKASYLQKMGFKSGKNLEMVRNDELNVKKLYHGHIDLMPFDEFSFSHLIKKSGLEMGQAEKLFKIPEISNELFLAASLETPDSVVADLKQALTKFKASKRYKEIKALYSK